MAKPKPPGPLDFSEAAAEVLPHVGLTKKRIADALGVVPSSLSRNLKGRRGEPEGWRGVLVTLARKGAEENEREATRLRALAERLEREGGLTT